MEFEGKNWKDRSVQFPGRRVLIPTDGSGDIEVDVERSEGIVYTDGDLISSENLNDLENRIGNTIVAGNAELVGLSAGLSAVTATLNANLPRLAQRTRTVTIPNTGWTAVSEGGRSFYRRDTGARGNATDFPEIGLPTYVIAGLAASVVLNNIGGVIYVESPLVPNIALTNAQITLLETREL